MQLLKSTAQVGAATITSRILGFIRDVVLARYFGASGETDAFFLAFKIPNFMRRLFAEGSFSLAFVPVLSEVRASGDRRALKDLVDHVAGTLAGILIAITAIGVLAAPVVLAIFAPGWAIEGREEFGLSAEMLRITFPYILLISLTALAGGILNTFGRFLIPALTPVLLNLSLIAAAVLLSTRMEVPVKALAWGVLLAGIVQLAVQVPALMRLGLIGSSVAQVNLLLDTVIATFLVSGSVSWLYYSDRLLEFPLGVFGVALSTVILPNLSLKFARQNPHGFSATLDWALRLALIITLPAALGLAVLASPILATLFQYDAFQMSDVDMSALSLSAYAAGLPAFIAVKVLAPGFYARQDTRTPVKIAVIAMVSNMVLNLIFVVSLLAVGFRGPHMGLALASSAAAYINAGLLYRMLRRQGVYQPEAGWGRVLLAVGAGCVGMVAFLVWQTDAPAQWAQWGASSRTAHLAFLIAVGAAVYAVAMVAGGLRLRHLEKGAT